MIQKPGIDPEFKALMPPLTDEEYSQLEQNILRRKCYDPIVLWDGTIVDGFNRFCICVEHGLEFKVEEMHFDSRKDAKIWIIQNQLGRRNLCDAARIELALCKADLLREKAKENLKRGGNPLVKRPKLNPEESIDVRKAIAEEAGVGAKTLGRYMQIKESATPELLAKVSTGEIKIGTAHRMLPSEIEKQLKRADKMYAYIKERLPFDDSDISSQIRKKLKGLILQLHELIKKAQDLGGTHNV